MKDIAQVQIQSPVLQYAGRDTIHREDLNSKRVDTLGVTSLFVEVLEVAYVGEAKVLLELVRLE